MNDRRKISVRDDLGQTIELDGPARRIVSLVPSITESLIDLGAGERLVGITRYCVYPEEVVARIAKVGGTKKFSFAAIDGLEPDLIIANKEENQRKHVEALQDKYPVFVTYPRTVEAAVNMVVSLGEISGTSERAGEFAARCHSALATHDALIVDRRKRTGCMIWRDPWMAAGADSYASDLLRTVGFDNVFGADDGRYPETTLESALERSPEIIILPDEPFKFDRSHGEEIRSFFERHGHAIRVLYLEGSYITWFGTRTLPGLRYLYAKKHELLGGER
jgi:ABC-type Fe3+-hydroxamate transport system substrate-binding protein